MFHRAHIALLATTTALLAMSACKATGSFTCDLDEQCRLGGNIGVCEPDGFCSFEDSACDSGRRYDDYAGDGLSGVCVSVDGDGGPDGSTGGDCAAAVTVGDGSICATDTGGGLWCWGRNNSDQLTGEASNPQLTPQKLTAPAGVTRLALGGNHTCARIAGDALVCFGDNSAGQLGDNSTTPSSTPVSPAVIGAVDDVAAGAEFTCAVASADGGVFCWGRNAAGQLGDGSMAQQDSPVRVQLNGGGDLVGASSVTAGDRFACARVGTSAFCWGDNDKSQIGDNTTNNQLTAVQVPIAGVREIEAGSQHTCARLNSSIVCWGDNDKGQTGNGSGDGIVGVPTTVGGFDEDPRRLSLGRQHSCATDEDGLRCWGANDTGQVDDPAGGELTSSRRINDLGRPDSASLGGDNTCAISGSLRCRGSNATGQLAIGSADPNDHATPNVVSIPCD